MSHLSSVFANSCLKRPVDPISKMPKTEYEPCKEKSVIEQSSIDSSSTCSGIMPNLEARKLKEFYRSIPDYADINHLPAEEFYSTLKSLRERKKIMLEHAVDHIDDCNSHDNKITNNILEDTSDTMYRSSVPSKKITKFQSSNDIRRNYFGEEKENNILFKNESRKQFNDTNIKYESLKRPQRKKSSSEGIGNKTCENIKVNANKSIFSDKGVIKHSRPKRIHSACSITWNDAKTEEKNEIDQKFDEFFELEKFPNINRVNVEHEFRTRSMPTSPVRSKKVSSHKNKHITVPKPFKMTERDEEERIVNELRSLRKSFSDDLLHQKCERKHFRARPVPIESRIPLYDKILEDQAMRRAITKVNSEAELRAQMKPFSFTKREEKGFDGICQRASNVIPKPKKKKRFKARPVPKNLFSNYFYEKMKENEYFRSMNRRIRAEEMLRSANLPASMGIRDRSRLSTPAAHSDLPIDPSPAVPSTSSSDRQRARSPTKDKKKNRTLKENFVTTSPQPFRFNTADRAAKKMQEVTKKVYHEGLSTDSLNNSRIGEGGRAYSALELRDATTGRSNLAALLRAEAVRKKFEIEAARRLSDQYRRVEMKQRDRLLRSKPAWHLVKNNHEEDIAMRLQTRRDEERMRREEFLHEMELMYGRVQQQPMLFERYYAPRSYSAVDTLQLSPRKSGGIKRNTRKNIKSYHYNTPNRSKVSINDTAETFNNDMMEYISKVDNDDKYTDSDVALNS